MDFERKSEGNNSRHALGAFLTSCYLANTWADKPKPSFKEGTEIIKQCYKELEEAELKVETLVKKDRTVVREPFKN